MTGTEKIVSILIRQRTKTLKDFFEIGRAMRQIMKDGKYKKICSAGQEVGNALRAKGIDRAYTLFYDAYAAIEIFTKQEQELLVLKILTESDVRYLVHLTPAPRDKMLKDIRTDKLRAPFKFNSRRHRFSTKSQDRVDHDASFDPNIVKVPVGFGPEFKWAQWEQAWLAILSKVPKQKIIDETLRKCVAQLNRRSDKDEEWIYWNLK